MLIDDNELSEIVAMGPFIEPVPAVEVDKNAALAPILYQPVYANAISYLRAIMSVNEHSPRSLALTKFIIARNPAHYTVWTFRYDSLLALQAPLEDELSYVEELAAYSSKNYQVWHHRELIVRTLAKSAGLGFDFVQAEKSFLKTMLDEDSKNYHVWSYRLFLCRFVEGFADGEDKVTETMIHRDPWNNSAWNHRYFVLFELDSPKKETSEVDTSDKTSAKEVQYIQSVIDRDPDNPAVWNYFKAVVKHYDRSLGDYATFVQYFDSLPALECLLDIYTSSAQTTEAKQICAELKRRDTIRSKYWDHKATLIA